MVGTPLTVGIGLQEDAVAFPAVVCRTYELMIVVETLGSRYAISAKWTSEMGSKPYFGRMPRQVRFSPQQRTVLEKIGSSALCPDAESCMQDRGVDGRIACSTGPGVILIRTFSSRNEVFEHGHPLFNIVADATVDGRLCVVIE